ncbi:hypothetical protein DY000_02027726 [Brassica cretica]|uniref:Uncharacterized protein n=1 Tax=Brassica cretica TaxID=69181 RepID=A0ABQ7ED95_BRACR|nr:hypothetical protein DY000_02027726 [Brassica cretica]
MSVVSLVTLHVNAVTVVAQEGVAAGAEVAVLDTGEVQATDAGVTAFVQDLLLLQGAAALHLLLLVVAATVDHHLRTEGVRNCLILMEMD